MKIIKVIYTANPEYVEQNISNIKTVMHDLQEQKLLNELPSFKHFQERLNASRPDEALSLLGQG